MMTEKFHVKKRLILSVLFDLLQIILALFRASLEEITLNVNVNTFND